MVLYPNFVKFFFFFWCSILLVVDIDIYLHFDRSTPIIFLDFFTTFFFRYPNFAHSRLFSAWDSFLLAQDELQVLEFPVLACLNRALMHEAPMHCKTRDLKGEATPVLIQGIHRRCKIDTVTTPSVYGNSFSKSSKELCKSRMTILPLGSCVSNIYCFEAPRGGYGKYKREQLENILKDSYSTFRSIVLNSDCNNTCSSSSSMKKKIELHIGYWGCGAYGGCHVLMVLLQIIAAKMAGVAHIIVHTGSKSNEEGYALTAIDLANQIPMNEKGACTLEMLLTWLLGQEFEWGMMDGN